MTKLELAKLYDDYAYLVHRRCERLLGNSSDAHDALQETFMRLQRYSPENVESMLGFLYAMATRVCFDALKAKTRMSPWPAQALTRLKEMVWEAPSDPDGRVCLMDQLSKLDAKTCEMALLHWLEGYTQEEIAERTGHTRKTVAKRLREAEATLRIHLDWEERFL